MLNAIKTALLSIWSNKVRSILNVLGVVIGVSSVTILIALGEGLKSDVSGMIQGLGTNVIAITGGKLDPSDPNGGANPANFISGDIFALQDIEDLQALDGVEAVAPVSLVSGSLKKDDMTGTGTVMGSTPDFIKAFEVLKVNKGAMFTPGTKEKVVVLGAAATEQLFGDDDPIGKTVTINKVPMKIVGTFAGATGSATFGSDLDGMTIIPFDVATEFNNDQVKIYRIITKAENAANVDELKKEITTTLKTNHDGEENFTVLTQDDMLGLFNTFLDMATAMVSAIAAISLVVGGIGIMNIMLVTVTERTREIGLRKAVGATKSAILFQFLVEAVIVTFVGALIGLAIAFIAALIVTAKTELTPSITPEIILLAAGISIVVGVIFGLWPAVRAAQKDPIEALRYE